MVPSWSGQRKEECSSGFRFSFAPDLTVMPFNYTPANRKSDSRTGAALLQALKKLKNSLSKLHVEPNSRVLNSKQPDIAIVMIVATYLNSWRIITPEFDGILNQILKQLSQLSGVSSNRGQISVFNGFAPACRGFDRFLQPEPLSRGRVCP